MAMRQDTEYELKNLERALLTDTVRNDSEAVSALLADSFFEFGSSGQQFDKAAVLDGIADGTSTERDVYSFKVTWLADDVALLTYKLARRAGSDTPIVWSLRSSVWKKFDERWAMVFHQGTLSKEEYTH